MSNSKILIIVSMLIFFSGCISLKPGGAKSAKKLFETFYVGEEGTQYFIKPLVFSNNQNKEKMLIDFTFRYKTEIKDSVTVNFSLLSPNIFKKIDSLSLSNSANTIISQDFNLLFNKKEKKFFNSRFSAKISLIEFKDMFTKDDWTINVYQPNFSITYVSGNKTNKAIKTLQENIFIIL
ncbi:MAG: hypothetical protein PHW82_11340 [Bacteroidales bacterium]|nr:hypothetical protein [Bacteroidales bacterium]